MSDHPKNLRAGAEISVAVVGKKYANGPFLNEVFQLSTEYVNSEKPVADIVAELFSSVLKNSQIDPFLLEGFSVRFHEPEENEHNTDPIE